MPQVAQAPFNYRYKVDRCNADLQSVYKLYYQMPNGDTKYQAYSVREVDMQMHPQLEDEVMLGLMDRAKADREESERAMPNVAYLNDTTGWRVTSASNSTNVWLDQTLCTPQYYDNGWQGTGTANPYVVYQTTNPPIQSGCDDNSKMPYSFGGSYQQIKKVNVRFKLGKHTLCMYKDVDENGVIDITDEDIARAKDTYFKEKRFQIITRKADSRAEDLLKMFISEVDFRSYKANGYFTVKQGNRVFRVYKDSHKHIDQFEKDNDRGIFVPKNRLCVHTERRVCPPADEALSKLLLIRSGKVEESANIHSADGLEKELVLV